MFQTIGENLATSLGLGLTYLANFLPRLISGIIILLIGLVIAGLVKWVVMAILKAVQLEKFLKQYNVPEGRKGLSWSNIVGELVRWFVIILFLIPTVTVWGIPSVTEILNRILLYIPNVLVAAIVLFLGMVIADLLHDVVQATVRGLSAQTANTAATTAKWAVMVFVTLVVLNQLGIASDLIRILFTGFVAMIAIAGGIAFGLGGKEAAGDAVNDLRKKLS
ncbi:MAG: hypothetical protein U1C56_01590 [Candidatus Curtissbacteria bacterium]|nr:hypothetical protein [Candidatus Curtissbacteria bacterium]